ncbi:MAG: recombination mediator RecR [Lentisphaeraceae bacterium]|nr:recombination mediator RecR [Lentisphaeraceae bacterium]
MSNSHYPSAFIKLINTISRLPGIGKRTAERLSLALYDWPENELDYFGEAISELKKNVKSCLVCGNFSDDDKCKICLDHSRDQSSICIIETVAQIPVIEKSGSFRGLYHILGGKLSPVNGIGPEALKVDTLLTRLDEVTEIILATSPDFDGEATASYIADILKEKNISITRIARGIPVGADISYADSASMAMAMNSRRQL